MVDQHIAAEFQYGNPWSPMDAIEHRRRVFCQGVPDAERALDTLNYSSIRGRSQLDEMAEALVVGVLVMFKKETMVRRHWKYLRWDLQISSLKTSGFKDVLCFETNKYENTGENARRQWSELQHGSQPPLQFPADSFSSLNLFGTPLFDSSWGLLSISKLTYLWS